MGRTLILLGLALLVVGGALLVGERLGLGKLPGDLVFRRKNWTVHVPLASSILISLVVTVLLNLWLRRK